MESLESLFVILESQVGPSMDVSRETAKTVVRALEARGEIEVKRTPTGRNRLNFQGFKRVAEEFRGAA